jgi:hypothetical protein
MSELYPFVVEMQVMLRNVEKWLDAAAEHAKLKGFDPNVFVGARLAPDQYPLAKQVQSACDAAKLAGARLTGKSAPKHEDDETTFAEVRARPAKALAFLETLRAEDFADAATRKVPLPFLPGGNKGALGLDYFARFAQPNFFFHVAHVYAILRHNGVPLGKLDYIGAGPPPIDL